MEQSLFMIEIKLIRNVGVMLYLRLSVSICGWFMYQLSDEQYMQMALEQAFLEAECGDALWEQCR